MSGLRGRGPAFAELDTPVTSERAPRLVESLASRRLLAMLRNTRQKWPMARLRTRADGFGVFMAAGTYLCVSYSGNLTAEDKRDWLALFATWLVADAEGLQKAPTPRDG